MIKEEISEHVKFRRSVIGKFIKYYPMLNDDETAEVARIVEAAKKRYFNYEDNGVTEIHKDATVKEVAAEEQPNISQN